MSHHGDNPYPDMGPIMRRMQDELLALKDASQSEITRKLLDTTGFIGATAEFPAGKLNKDDEGAIQFAIGQDGDKVILDFGKSVHWVGMTASQAAELASSLMRAARKVGRKTGETVTLTLG